MAPHHFHLWMEGKALLVLAVACRRKPGPQRHVSCRYTMQLWAAASASLGLSVLESADSGLALRLQSPDYSSLPVTHSHYSVLMAEPGWGQCMQATFGCSVVQPVRACSYANKWVTNEIECIPFPGVLDSPGSQPKTRIWVRVVYLRGQMRQGREGSQYRMS